VKTLVHTDYNAPVESVFGSKAEYDPNKEGLRFGWEYEVTCRSRDYRYAFLEHLEKQGWGEWILSKHDGSTGFRFPTELVSLPFPFERSRELLHSLGREVEAFSDKGLSLAGCAVHIHTTKSAIPRPVLWRMVQAVTASSTHTPLWAGHGTFDKETGRRHHNLDKDALRRHMDEAALLAEFWNLVALRSENDYSMRAPYNDVNELMRANGERNHHRAVVPGQRTPTIEWRIFRAARQPRVLTSYLEILEALRVFSSEAPSHFCTGVGKGWTDGLFPLQAFLPYIQEHSHRYPSIAARLRLSKFNGFTSQGARMTQPTSEPHEDIRRGCLVWDDHDEHKTTWTVLEVRDSEPDTPIIVRSEGQRRAHIYPGSVIHVCPSAISKGVFE